MNPQHRIGVVIALVATISAFQAKALTAEEMACGTFSRADRLTPEDYRTPSRRLANVEHHHFQPSVENLTRHMQGSFGSDIDYTLWGYPNHHRALATLVKLGQREKTDQPRGSSFTIDCYFRRALRFAPDDLIVRMLYADYLGRVERKDDAMRQLAFVTAEAGNNPFTHYNAGLVYLQLGAYTEARAQAHQAEALGFDRPQLREALEKAGHWQPRVAQATPDMAASQPVPPR